jgi:hypothetical protein
MPSGFTRVIQYLRGASRTRTLWGDGAASDGAEKAWGSEPECGHLEHRPIEEISSAIKQILIGRVKEWA